MEACMNLYAGSAPSPKIDEDLGWIWAAGQALLAFKDALHDPLGIFNTWKLSDEDPCLWKGVKCGRKKHVIGL
jgi:hypothetical protein